MIFNNTASNFVPINYIKEYPGYSILISNVSFYIKNKNEIEEYVTLLKGETKGVVISFDSDQNRLAFLLKFQ